MFLVFMRQTGCGSCTFSDLSTNHFPLFFSKNSAFRPFMLEAMAQLQHLFTRSSLGSPCFSLYEARAWMEEVGSGAFSLTHYAELKIQMKTPSTVFQLSIR
jgi:hypothetical protein